MPYGRNIVVSKWTVQNDLYDVMEQETIDAGELATLAREEQCAYIILPETIFTVVTTLILYRLFLYISRKLEEMEKRRDTTIV